MTKRGIAAAEGARIWFFCRVVDTHVEHRCPNDLASMPIGRVCGVRPIVAAFRFAWPPERAGRIHGCASAGGGVVSPSVDGTPAVRECV
jgi:hypothetical protein